MFFNDWLSKRRLYTPDRVAVVDDSDGRHYTYAELDERASRLAGFLQKRLGVARGERVACLSTNRIEYIDLYFACGKIGAVLVPLNFRLPTAAILELLQDCRPKVFVYEAGVCGHGPGGESSMGLNRSRCRICRAMTQQSYKVHQADENEVAMILVHVWDHRKGQRAP